MPAKKRANSRVTAPKKAPVSPAIKLAQEIIVGRHDEDMGEVLKAVYERAFEIGRMTVWRLVVGVHEFKSEVVTTIKVMVEMEERTGLPWSMIKDPGASAFFANAWAVCLLTIVVGMAEEEAQSLVDNIPADDLLEGFRREMREVANPKG